MRGKSFKMIGGEVNGYAYSSYDSSHFPQSGTAFVGLFDLLYIYTPVWSAVFDRQFLLMRAGGSKCVI